MLTMKKLIPLAGLLSVLTLALASFVAIASAGEAAVPPDDMPFKYGQGYAFFQDRCAECHGPSLNGTDKGPPLLHGFYKPSHHADMAFYRAIQIGSPQHHWNFGAMPPVENVNDEQASAIIAFVRWFQRNAGLY